MATPHGKPERFGGGLTAVGPGCHAWIQPNGEWFESNAGLVAGEGESLLVDTLADLALTRRMLGAMAAVTDGAAVRTVVNTHSDADHIHGNQLVDGAEIVSSRRSAALMRAANPGSLEGFRKLARAMRVVPGRPRTIGAYLVDMLAPFDFRGIEVRPPTREFEGEDSLDVGGRRVRLIEVGPAHTPGDLMVHVPDAGVVYTGDILFVGSTPVMWAGPVGNWIAAIDTLLALDADVYVPGHGPVCGRPEAEAVKRYWQWLDAAARERLGRGMSPWETARDIALSPDFAAHEWSSWSAPERLVVNVHTLDRERRGALGGEASPRELISLFSRVALLARELAPPS